MIDINMINIWWTYDNKPR